ncbi:MlaA family lipoprotein [Tepidicella baoligensis]|uniref:MlaA family lipoprotein n=1 Tax=Tepidicella baoligensis TaxID=2707016 RepID=UPI0015DAB72B|nr:VacJ family lipoprotein [Tepidicella baoligensis]
MAMVRVHLGAGLLAMLLLTGCATGPNAHPQDPLEPFNRGVMRFNDGLDEAVLRPVAVAYRDTVPSPIRTGVSNFFGNLRDLWSSVNALLQARPKEAAENFMRFNVNTFFGLAGVLDIATEMGLERTRLDIGQTLGRWGVPTGPYLVLPFFGPSSVRDGLGLVVDRQGDWVTQGVDHIPTRNSLYALRITDTRATLLPATDMLENIALDKYTFTRDTYLQRRAAQTRGPVEEERFDLDD